MNRDLILGLMRQVLTFVGGYIVARGWMDDATTQQVVGALVVLVSAAWTAYQASGVNKADAVSAAGGIDAVKQVTADKKAA